MTCLPKLMCDRGLEGDSTESSLTACFFRLTKSVPRAQNFWFKATSAQLPEYVNVDTLNDRAESLFTLEPRLYS